MTMMNHPPRRITRRRALQILAVGGGALALSGSRAVSTACRVPVAWRGVALGAPASVTLYVTDRDDGRRLLSQVTAEVNRLEKIFSLYKPDSALSSLNRQGHIDAPPLDLVRLLTQARRFSELTQGAFDVTVQPLWDVYAQHFQRPTDTGAGPERAVLDAALECVDYRAVEVTSQRITLKRPRMAITLNGIAQGYITDRVADLLRGAGLEQVMIDLGEVRCLGRHPDGRSWKVGINHPADPSRLIHSVSVHDRAVATSAGEATAFDRRGRYHHLFDPRNGRSSNRYRSVTVVAASATVADALSTGLSHLGPKEAASVIAALRPATVFLFDHDGALTRIGQSAVSTARSA